MIKNKILVAVGTVGSGITLLVAPLIASAATLVTVPSFDTLVASTTAPAQGTFDTFLAIGMFLLGLFVGSIFLLAVIRAIKGAAKRILGGQRRGGRRRR